MAEIDDESGAPIADESGLVILDEAGPVGKGLSSFLFGFNFD